MLFRSDLGQYNYEIISDEELETVYKDRSVVVNTPFNNIVKPEQRKNAQKEIYWKNPDMTRFDAVDIASEIATKKSKLDFRPGCYTLSYKLKEPSTVDSKLEMSFDKFDSILDFSIESYINKKLNNK